MSRRTAACFSVLSLLACSSDKQTATTASDAGDAGQRATDAGPGSTDAARNDGGGDPTDGSAPRDALTPTPDARTDGNDAAPDAASGQRLRAIVHRAQAGAEQLTSSIYDTELEQPCRFAEVGEDNGEPVFRCLNARTIVLAFRDEDCTEPVGANLASCGEPIAEGDVVVGIRPKAPGCGGIREYFVAEEPTTASELYSLDSGECEPTAAFLDRPLVGLGELDVSPYVEGRLVSTVIDEETDFEIVHIEGGGVRTFYEYRVSGTPCNEFSIGEQSVCLPPNTASAGQLFSDATCETPLAETPALSGCPAEPTPKPDYAIYYERSDGCSRPAGYHAVGSGIEPKSVHYGSDGCSASNPNVDTLYYSLGEEVGFELLPRFAERNAATSGRLSAVQWAAAGGAAFNDTGYFYDLDLDTQCSAQDTAEHGIRCIPEGRFPTEGSYFSDAECTSGLLYVITSGCNAPLADEDLFFEMGFEACQSHVASGHRIEAYTGAVYEGSTGGCSLVTEQTLQGRHHTVVELGAEVPLDSFAPLERVGDTSN